MKSKLKERLQCRGCKMPYCDALCTDLSDKQIDWIMSLVNQRVIEELEAICYLANPIECQGGYELFINIADLEKIIRIKELKQD